ncbi:MAG: sigma-70 family RNA polymerase sigma factor [Candidatus Binataceae bacterium]|jgi:RNA polymerase sigma-70 factor (ECF subfamily)
MAVKEARPGDKRLQFEQVALPHLDTVYTAALRLTHNRDDASDLVQETILRAFRFFHQFTAGSNCRAWLLTILYNNFRDRYRQNGRERPTNSGEIEQELEAHSLLADMSLNNPEELLSDRMIGRRIESALNGLPPEFRETLVLVDVQELNYQEVAEILAVPLGTVKSRVSRARALMRVALIKMDCARGKTGS